MNGVSPSLSRSNEGRFDGDSFWRLPIHATALHSIALILSYVFGLSVEVCGFLETIRAGYVVPETTGEQLIHNERAEWHNGPVMMQLGAACVAPFRRDSLAKSTSIT